MHPMLTIATRAARAAGNIITQGFFYDNVKYIDEKSRNDFVTNIDKEAEQAIIQLLRKTYPEHSILGEEYGIQYQTDSDYVWIIDPLDGTNNFVHNIPHFSISIALKIKGKLEIGLVFDPIRDELFTASKGGGAKLNDHRLRVNKQNTLENASLATALPFKQKQHTEAYLQALIPIYKQCADIRRMGSAALDLAYVAAGRFDGYFELGLQPWDFAAGQLLVKESGGLITDFSGGTDFEKSGNIVAGSPRLVQALTQSLQPFF